MKTLTAASGAPSPAMDGDSRRWWVLTVLCLSLIVVTIDTTILNVALPTLVKELHPSSSQLEWIVDAYTVVFAGLLLTMGGLGDRFGRKGALSVGLVIFGIGCVLSAVSQTPAQLIATRGVTGIGAALIFPATLSILIHVFPDAVERQKAIAIWSGTAGVGIGLGPVAGGFLLRHFSWGSIFWVNVPVCAVALIGGALVMPTSKDPTEAPIDVPGALLSIVGLSSLVFAIIQGPADGWTSPTVLGAFILSAVTLAGFGMVELRRRHPMLDFRLFRNPRFSAATFAMTALYFCLFGTIYFQTTQLQSVMGYDPLGAGLRSLPFAVLLLLVANATPRLVARVGARPIVAGGLFIVAISLALRSTYGPGTGYPMVLLGQVVFALGMGLTVAPATASIMGAVPPNRAGVGSAINDTTRQVGGSLGVALMGSIGASLYHARMRTETGRLNLSPEVSEQARDSIGSAIEAASHLPADGATALVDASRSAFMHGNSVASLVAIVVALIGAAASLRFLPRLQRAPGNDATMRLVADEPVLVAEVDV